MPDVGFTHVALPVTDLDSSIEFYSKYARMKVIHDPDGHTLELSYGQEVQLAVDQAG
ncbi:MAG: VOC family protein [Gemmatimonadota bacterium]